MYIVNKRSPTSATAELLYKRSPKNLSNRATYSTQLELDQLSNTDTDTDVGIHDTENTEIPKKKCWPYQKVHTAETN